MRAKRNPRSPRIQSDERGQGDRRCISVWRHRKRGPKSELSKSLGAPSNILPNFLLFHFCPDGYISPIGWPPTTLPEPIKRARDKDLCGFAGEGNVAERSERMRAERNPTSPRIQSEERGWACYVLILAPILIHVFFISHRTPGGRGAKSILFAYFIFVFFTQFYLIF